MNRERAFAAAIRISAESRPDCFSIQEGDLCFLDWHIPAWLMLAAHGPILENLLEELTVARRTVDAT